MYQTGKQSGFTMLEILVVMVIVAILAGLAAPSFRTTIQNGRLNEAYNQLQNAVTVARMEAIRQGNPIGLTSRVSSDWSSGYVVFEDANNDNAWDSGEEIQLWDPLNADMAVVTQNSSPQLTFMADGSVSVQQVFIICDARTGVNQTARRIELLVSGAAYGSKASSCT